MKTIILWSLLLVVTFSLCSYIMYQRNNTPHVIYLQISTSSPAKGQSVQPEQRIKFAKDFEKLFHDKRLDGTVIANGDQHKIITISGKIVNETSVYGMKDNVDAIQDMREVGFKHLIMTDGIITWDIDLKN